jgi:hypothetical protein
MTTEETDKAVAAFLRDLFFLYQKHGMSISHEYGHGSFIIEPFSEFNMKWVACAMVRLNGGGGE